MWTGSIHPEHFINNQNPSTEESSASNTFLGCLARCLWGGRGRILKRWAPKPILDYFTPCKRSRKASGGLVFGEEIEIRLLNILHQSSLACATVASVPFARKQKASMTATRSYMSGALLLYWERSSKYENVPVNFSTSLAPFMLLFSKQSPLPAGALTVYWEQILPCILKVHLQFNALRYFIFLPNVPGAGIWDINESTSLLEAKD